MAAPSYVAGIDFNPSVRKDAFDVMGRLVEHFRNKSTDLAESQWAEPVHNYRDADLFHREIRPCIVRHRCHLRCRARFPSRGRTRRLTWPARRW